MPFSVSISHIEQRIYWIRGFKVMLDSDLAYLYGVSTMRLNEQVRRNLRRFPPDFMFQLTPTEFKFLISQIAISSSTWGGRRKLPLVFTQEGVAMLSGVLHSARAIDVNIAIMRAFIKLREALSHHKELAGKLGELEARVGHHNADIQEIFCVLKKLMTAPKEPLPKRIGFVPEASKI